MLQNLGGPVVLAVIQAVITSRTLYLGGTTGPVKRMNPEQLHALDQGYTYGLLWVAAVAVIVGGVALFIGYTPSRWRTHRKSRTLSKRATSGVATHGRRERSRTAGPDSRLQRAGDRDHRDHRHAADVHAGRHHRDRRPAPHAGRPAALRRRQELGDHRLRAHLRRSAAPGGRSATPSGTNGPSSPASGCSPSPRWPAVWPPTARC